MPTKNILTALLLGAMSMSACSDDEPGALLDDKDTRAGAAGDAGASGESGSAGSGGEDNEQPQSDDERLRDERFAACLRINACEADGGTPDGIQVCLSYTYEEPWMWSSTGAVLLHGKQMECKLAATSCAEIKACAPAPATFNEACAEHPGETICQGDVWIACAQEEGAGAIDALDCEARGESCDAQIWAGCGKMPCDFASFEPSCDALDPHVLIECDPSGFLKHIDCRTQYNHVAVHGPNGDANYTIAGEVCGFDEQRGSNGCVGEGEECSWFSSACEGDVLVTCAGGMMAHRDCAALLPSGQTCGYIQAGPFTGYASCGLAPAGCSLDDDERCDDGKITVCKFDEQVVFDCLGAGYNGCAEEQRGGRSIAYCTQ